MKRVAVFVICIAALGLVISMSTSELSPKENRVSNIYDKSIENNEATDTALEFQVIYTEDGDLNDNNNGIDSIDSIIPVSETKKLVIWLKAISQPTSCSQKGYGVVTLQIETPNGETVFSESFSETEEINLEFNNPQIGNWNFAASAVKYGNEYETGYIIRVSTALSNESHE
jgi:hypothetical protein